LRRCARGDAAVRFILLLALAASLMTVGAALGEASNPLVGQWTVGDRDTCRAPGDSDEARITIQPRRIILYEGYCNIRSMRKISPLQDSAWRLRVHCTEEGTKRRGEMLLALTRKTSFHDDILVRIDRDSGVVFTYQRCPQ
jgi:hypothetical protein